MPSITLTLLGNQLGRFTSISGTGSQTNRVVTLTGAQAIGTAAQRFTVVIDNFAATPTEFLNGLRVTIFDSNGTVVMPATFVQPDGQEGQGAGDEHLIIESQKIIIDLGGLPAIASTLTYAQVDQAAALDKGDNDGNLDFADFICFATNTRIATPLGPRPVEHLGVGDLVVTQDHGAQPIRWIGRRKIALAGAPGRPVMLQRGALGPGIPSRDLVLSPQHRVLLAGARVAAAFGVAEVLALSDGLTGLPKVRPMLRRRSVEYHSILFDRHEIVFAEDCACESFMPGPQALKLIGPTLRRELLALHPTLRLDPRRGYGDPARRILTRRQVHGLLATLPKGAVLQTTRDPAAAEARTG